MNDHATLYSIRTRAFARRALAALWLVGCGAAPKRDDGDHGCPPAMARIDPRTTSDAPYCIDRFEGSLVEVTMDGERPLSPYAQIKGRRVRAVTRGGVIPQAYLSRNEADLACRASAKRLCTEREWVGACEGDARTAFPYGRERKSGACNDRGRPPLLVMRAMHASPPSEWEAMNDPRLNALPDTVARTGSFASCRTPSGIFDMVGNLHEWVDDRAGTFLGGYYLDTHLNGDGCHYKTVAHDAAYHDYSTGFRCCAPAR